MKKIFALPLLIVAGCSAATPRSFETKLSLTPLPAAQAVAPKSDIPADPQSDAWEKHLKTLRTSAEADKALKDVHLWQHRVQMVSQRVSLIKDKATHDRLQQQQTQIFNGLRSLERAVVIKQAQIQANDFSDSTGEVAKYIAASHQFQANAARIMKATGNTACCGTSRKP